MKPPATTSGDQVTSQAPAPEAPRVQMLDVFVALLSELDAPIPSHEFYGRICQAVCRLTSMERVALFLYDEALHRVRAVGSWGMDRTLLEAVDATLEESPLARRALSEDRVVEVSEQIEREVPAEYARLLGLTTLTCTPLAAAGRRFGVLFADRGGGHFRLTDAERHAMWTLGKVGALAEAARIATRHQERTRGLADRIDLTREIHEQVIQRLFGVSLALSAGQELSAAERARCALEMQTALADLRTALRRPLALSPRETQTTLRAELERLERRRDGVPLELRWQDSRPLPSHVEPLAQSVLAEALRNAQKHAEPTRVEVSVGSDEGTFQLEVMNDGIRRYREKGTGMGLRLAQFEALQQGGVVEFGPLAGDRWRLRLVVPLEDA